MRIHTLWVEHDVDAFELVFAWDEYTRDESPQRYGEEYEKALNMYPAVPRERMRHVVIEIPDGALADAFKTPAIAGTLV